MGFGVFLFRIFVELPKLCDKSKIFTFKVLWMLVGLVVNQKLLIFLCCLKLRTTSHKFELIWCFQRWNTQFRKKFVFITSGIMTHVIPTRRGLTSRIFGVKIMDECSGCSQNAKIFGIIHLIITYTENMESNGLELNSKTRNRSL